jgi:hypothetical protein
MAMVRTMSAKEKIDVMRKYFDIGFDSRNGGLSLALGGMYLS